MRSVVALSMLVFISLDLCFNTPIIQADAQDNWIQVSCFTQSMLSLDYLGLSLIVYENNSVLVIGSTQFEAMGNQPILRIEIDSYGRVPSEPFGIITSDVAFFMVNGSRDYYAGSYYENYSVNTTVENGIAKYQADFSEDVQKAMNLISKNGTAADYGVRGRMTFEVVIGNSVGAIMQKRFFRILLRTLADLPVIACSVTVPQTASHMVAKNGAQDMRRIVPYSADTSIAVRREESAAADLYLEWEMPEQVPLIIGIVYNPIFLTVIGLIGGSLLGRYPWVWVDERRQKKQFARKLIAELQGIIKDMKEYKQISTTIYDSLTSKLLLLSTQTGEIVKKTYEEVKRKENIGYVAIEREDGRSPLQHATEETFREIQRAIKALRKEIGDK